MAHNRRITIGDTGRTNDKWMKREIDKDVRIGGIPSKVSLATCSRERCERRLEYLEGLLRGGKRKVYPEVLRLRRELREGPFGKNN